MDLSNIPSCALFRHGTVIVRLKMEVSDSCCQPGVRLVEDYPVLVHRLSRCEQCARTRLNSRYSDCDSGIVEKCRPYRASAARSRYVNVCAAVCLLLLVSGLAPKSSAAPRHKRSPNMSEENPTWENPCDLNNSGVPINLKYDRNFSLKVARQANSALREAEPFKYNFTKLHSYESFINLTKTWIGTNWLQETKWHIDEVLPKEKNLGERMPEEYVTNLMSPSKLREVLPLMYKSLKYVVAGLIGINGTLDHFDPHLGRNLGSIGRNHVRAVLCEFDMLMRSQKQKKLPLLDDETYQFKRGDILQDAFLVYRDTLNFLEYIEQFFEKMYEMLPDEEY